MSEFEEDVMIPEKKPVLSLNEDEKQLDQLDKTELEEASESTISDFDTLKDKQTSKREERQIKIASKVEEKVKWVKRAEEQEKRAKEQQEKQDLLTGFIIQSMNNSQMMMSQFLQKEKPPLQTVNQNSSILPQTIMGKQFSSNNT